MGTSENLGFESVDSVKSAVSEYVFFWLHCYEWLYQYESSVEPTIVLSHDVDGSPNYDLDLMLPNFFVFFLLKQMQSLPIFLKSCAIAIF